MSYDYDEYRKKLKERYKVTDATMPPPKKEEGYKTKHSITTKLPMHLGTFDPRKKKRRSELDDETLDDLTNYLGYRPQGATVTNERTYYTDSTGNRY